MTGASHMHLEAHFATQTGLPAFGSLHQNISQVSSRVLAQHCEKCPNYCGYAPKTTASWFVKKRTIYAVIADLPRIQIKTWDGAACNCIGTGSDLEHASGRRQATPRT